MAATGPRAGLINNKNSEGAVDPQVTAPHESPGARRWRPIFRALLCAAAVGILGGCATPTPVKQALTSLDEAYSDNADLMRQYKEVVVQTNTRYQLWSRYVQSRGLMNLAVKWSTTNPASASKAAVDAEAAQLGAPLKEKVNAIRMTGLPPAHGEQGVVFVGGSKDKDGRDKTIEGVIEALPSLANLVNKRLDELASARIKNNDLTAFDDYQTNLAALRQINATVKSYLDIDVTIKTEDFKELIKAVHDLR